MKATTGTKELLELQGKLKPELERLSKKFKDEVHHGDYIQRILKHELSDEDDPIADPSGTSIGFTFKSEIDVETEDKKVNLCIRMITTFDIVDKNFEGEEEY